jgi:hypothetical protein
MIITAVILHSKATLSVISCCIARRLSGINLPDIPRASFDHFQPVGITKWYYKGDAREEDLLTVAIHAESSVCPW